MSTNAEGMAADPITAVRAQESLGLGVVNQENTRTSNQEGREGQGGDRGWKIVGGGRQMPRADQDDHYGPGPREHKEENLWEDDFDVQDAITEHTLWESQRAAEQAEARQWLRGYCARQRAIATDAPPPLLSSAYAPLRVVEEEDSELDDDDVKYPIMPPRPYELQRKRVKRARSSRKRARADRAWSGSSSGSSSEGSPSGSLPERHAIVPGSTGGGGSAGPVSLDNPEGRTIPVSYASYVVPQMLRAGLRERIQSDNHGDGLGITYASQDDLVVELPVGLVEALGVYWSTGKEHSWANYIVSVTLCRNLCRRIQFKSPDAEETAAVYGPIVAYMLRGSERKAVNRYVRGIEMPRAVVHAAQCAVMGAIALNIPIAACAATALQPWQAPAVTFSALMAVCAALGVTAATALAYAARCGLFPSDPVRILSKGHQEVAAITCTAKPPPAKADSRVATNAGLKPDDRINKGAVVTGIAVAGCEPTVFATNQLNTVAALAKRSLAEPPAFDPDLRRAAIARIVARRKRLLGAPFQLTTPTDPDAYHAYVEAWIQGSNSSGAMKKRYRSENDAMLAEGITGHSTLSNAQIREWTRRDVGVKRETVLKDPTGSPRQILAAHPRFTLLVAPFVSQYTGVVKKAWSRASPKPHAPVMYAPGMQSRTIAQAQEGDWNNKANLDFSKYDLCQGADIAREDLAQFRRYGAPKAVVQLLEANSVVIRGASRDGTRFTASPVRYSGDPHTTVQNTSWNIELVVDAMAQHLGRDPTSADMFHCAGGDDGSLLYQGNRADLSGLLGQIGFPITIKHVDHLHQLEFLGCRWTRTSLGAVYVPMAGKMMGKLGYSVHADSTNAPSIARGAVASFKHSAAAVPPLAALVTRVLELTADVPEIAPRDEPWKMTTGYTGEATDETWAHLWDIYGYTREIHAEWVKQLAHVDEVGVVIESSIARMLVERDFDRETPEAGATGEDIPSQLPPPAAWSPTAKARNAEQHALNGNIVRKASTPRPVFRVKPQEPLARSTTDPAAAAQAMPVMDDVYVKVVSPVDAGDLAGAQSVSGSKAAAGYAALRVDVPRGPASFDYYSEDEDSDRDITPRLSLGCIELIAKVVAEHVAQALSDRYGLIDDGYTWALSAKARNKRKHADNGNPGQKGGGKQRKGDRKPDTSKAVVVYKAPKAKKERTQRPGPLRSMSGMVMDPRADMSAYMMTLCDAERYPPVRLGGESTTPTALTQLHGTFTVNLINNYVSVVVHPRLWTPVMVSQSSFGAPGQATPYLGYSYSAFNMFTAAQVSTLAGIADSARVVSAKIKVYTSAAATADNGILYLGLVARDDGFLNNLENTTFTSAQTNNGVVGNVSTNNASRGGFPIVGTPSQTTGTNGTSPLSATQGYSEFATYDTVEEVPLKMGSSSFWMPEDPQSYTFVPDRLAQQILGNTSVGTVNASPIADPFWVIGVIGAGGAAAASITVELYLNLEYVVSSGASSVIATRPGVMSTEQAFHVVKRVTSGVDTFVEPDPEASFGDKLISAGLQAGKGLLKAGLPAASKFLFGSSDVGSWVSTAIGL